MQLSQPSQKKLDRFLDQIPPQVEATFTPAQLEAMRQALEAQTSWQRHPIDIRLSLPWFPNRAYLVLLIGTERRHPARRAMEAQTYSLWAWKNSLLIGLVTTTGGLALLSLVLLSGMEWRTYQELSHPVGVPFKTNRQSCEESHRTWLGDKCIDYEHDPTF